MKKCRSIMLIDDSDLDNYASKKLIERLGITNDLKVFKNGLEAINYLHILTELDHAPDLIFLDLSMPVMNGFDFLKNFKKLLLENKHEIKIVVLSSSTSTIDKVKADILGCSEYLIKPLTAEKIMSMYERMFQTV